VAVEQGAEEIDLVFCALVGMCALFQLRVFVVVEELYFIVSFFVRRYPYISHLICNAGIVGFSHMDWFRCIKQMPTDPMMAVNSPTYYPQHQGQMTKDGRLLALWC